MDIDALPFIQARLFRVNPGRPIDWIVVHDMEAPEGPLTAENVAKYFQTAAAKGSAHINVDNNSCVRSVKDEHQAAHAPGANTNGLGVELAGYARQTRLEWLDDYSIATMEHAANCVAQWMRKWGVPNQYVDIAGLRAGRRGWTTHNNVSKAFGKSTHWDPGPNFPIDYFQSRIDYYYYPQGDDFLSALTDQQQRELHQWMGELYLNVVGPDVPQWGDQNPRHNSIMTRIFYMFNLIAAGDNTREFAALLDNAIKDSANIDELGQKLETVETELRALKEATDAKV